MFSRRKAADVPVQPLRRDLVMRAVKFGMAELDAIDREDDRARVQAKTEFDAVMLQCTPEEMTAVWDAVKRYGY
ncbi:hypothetical protein AB0H63_25775 [Micromonospora echinospora]|uniref:hypothetical protein n=1 Tax=Micromonospora echinospora TaxID=1877 RepID=UPI0033C95E58